MLSKTFLKNASQKTKSRETVATSAQQFGYIFLGLLFGGMLTLSAMNDYLFFGWLAMGAFIIFALVGMHIIGMNQIKRN